jgi:P pilus assembly protein, pilin FimA
MNKLPYLLSAALTMSAFSALAVDSTITITGYVHDNACAVSTTSKNLTVDLQAHAAKQFYAVGASTAMIPFSIVLSPCGGSVTAVKVGFSGTADSANTTLLGLNQTSSTASGIGVQILDGNQVALPLNAPFTSIAWTPLTGSQTNILNFYARMMATRVPITAGQVDADATFTLEFQ